MRKPTKRKPARQSTGAKKAPPLKGPSRRKDSRGVTLYRDARGHFIARVTFEEQRALYREAKAEVLEARTRNGKFKPRPWKDARTGRSVRSSDSLSTLKHRSDRAAERKNEEAARAFDLNELPPYDGYRRSGVWHVYLWRFQGADGESSVRTVLVWFQRNYVEKKKPAIAQVVIRTGLGKKADSVGTKANAPLDVKGYLDSYRDRGSAQAVIQHQSEGGTLWFDVTVAVKQPLNGAPIAPMKKRSASTKGKSNAKRGKRSVLQAGKGKHRRGKASVKGNRAHSGAPGKPKREAVGAKRGNVRNVGRTPPPKGKAKRRR